MIDEANRLTHAEFVAKFGFLFEHSPWVVEQVADRRPFQDVDALRFALVQTVVEAGPDMQLALLRAHPQLGDRVAIADGLTKHSASEQRSVGLDQLTEAEYRLFHHLNESYSQRFGFPFIVCVRLTDKDGILAAMESRLENDPSTELQTALEEVFKIVSLRLRDVLEGVAP